MLTRASVQRVILICAVFVTVLSGGAYVTSDQFGFSQWLSKGNGSAFANVGRSEMPTGGSNLPENDPVRNFAKTGVGQVLFSASSSDNCRRTLFDNRTGASYEGGEVFCGQNPDHATGAQSADRLMSMGKSFQK